AAPSLYAHFHGVQNDVTIITALQSATLFSKNWLATNNMDLSVVIPVYRSESTLRELFRRLIAVLDVTGLQYELVCVDDGSPDNSWRVLEDLRKQHEQRVVIIQLMRNFGQHNALMCGFRHSRGDYVITMDDDLQNPPEEIPKLLAAIKENDFDLV